MPVTPEIKQNSGWMRRNKSEQTAPACKPGIIQKILSTLNQKGDPTLIPCAYCGKAINKSEIVEHELIYINGSQLARKTNLYCSKRCAEYDQMAHES